MIARHLHAVDRERLIILAAGERRTRARRECPERALLSQVSARLCRKGAIEAYIVTTSTASPSTTPTEQSCDVPQVPFASTGNEALPLFETKPAANGTTTQVQATEAASTLRALAKVQTLLLLLSTLVASILARR